MLIDISTRVSCLMAEKHLSAYDMRKLGVDPKTLNGVFHKPEGTKLGTLLKIAKALDVELDEILETPTSRDTVFSLRSDLYKARMKLLSEKSDLYKAQIAAIEAAIEAAIFGLSIIIYALILVYGVIVLQRIA